MTSFMTLRVHTRAKYGCMRVSLWVHRRADNWVHVSGLLWVLNHKQNKPRYN